VDASTDPDQTNLTLRPAGLGIFILNFQDQRIQAIYIKAKLQSCSSVIMAEAACLALAFAICSSLNLTGVNFLSDCEQVIHFFRNDDLANPPDWRINYYTQSFVNFTSTIAPSIYKIRRRLNTTTDSLARQARQLQTP
jgi:hypothetical protein